MASGQPLSVWTILNICELLEAGDTYKAIAEKLGISVSSVWRVKKQYFKEGHMEVIIAGDKKHGQLIAIGNNNYSGTCTLANGKRKKKIFRSSESRSAIQEWEDWCAELKKEEDIPQRTPEPDHEERPAPKEEVEAMVQDFNDRPEQETPVIFEPVVLPEPQMPVTPPAKKLEGAMYLLVMGDPKVAGYFTDFEQAMKFESVMNQALKFAGVEGKYQVMEVGEYQAPEL